MNTMHVSHFWLDGEMLWVEFSDGQRAAFVGYRDSPIHGIDGLRSLTLYNAGNRSICMIEGEKHHAGPMPDEGKIRFLAEGWSQQQVAAYWRSACTYFVDQMFPPWWQRLIRWALRQPDTRPYRECKMVTKGGLLLQQLEENRAEFLTPR